MDDLMQDATLALLGSIAGLRQPECFRAWAMRIATRVGHRYWTSFAREQHAMREAERHVAAQDAYHVPPACIHAEEVRLLLAHLTDDDQRLLRMRYLRDLPYRDIAALLGCRPGVARVRAHRACQKLRRLAGAEEEA